MSRATDIAEGFKFLAQQTRLVATLCRMHGEDALAEMLDGRAQHDDRQAVAHQPIQVGRIAR